MLTGKLTPSSIKSPVKNFIATFLLIVAISAQAKQANDRPKEPIALAAANAMDLKAPERRDDGLAVADLSSVKSDKEALSQLVVQLGDGESLFP